MTNCWRPASADRGGRPAAKHCTSDQRTVYVGQSADTPQFAFDVIARWWESIGCSYYLSAERLLILADGGGSNAYRSRLWKQPIQQQLGDRYGLTLTVCHYPTGCSKWNPVEHRLFGPISLNWAGQPLLDWETMLAFIRGTTTTGLTVQAFFHEGVYQTGGTVSDAEMETLNIERHPVCPPGTTPSDHVQAVKLRRHPTPQNGNLFLDES